MRHLTRLAALACTLLFAGAASAAVVTAPPAKNSAGQFIDTQPVICVDASGAYSACGGAVPAEATNCSGTITTGGTAQDLFPAGQVVHGWALENQSAGDVYVRSKGAAGTTAATTDQNSLKVPSAYYYEAPHVSAYAVSIIGATTGQAFYCRTW